MAVLNPIMNPFILLIFDRHIRFCFLNLLRLEKYFSKLKIDTENLSKSTKMGNLNQNIKKANVLVDSDVVPSTAAKSTIGNEDEGGAGPSLQPVQGQS